MPAAEPAELLEAARRGDRRSLGRLLSHVEGGGRKAQRVAALTFPLSASPDQVVGITGAPGAGKSTLTSGLIAEARRSGPVAVLAVDPTSPFSGGAILGDRVRMQEHAGDAGVFIRSMASRGHFGGLALAVPEAVRTLVAAGFDRLIVETVGVGQVEVAVAGATDTTVVVVTPGWGDSVQAAKAGLLEIADVLVVNKADRPGAEEARCDLVAMLDVGPAAGDWRPPIVLTDATTAAGVAELWAAIREHRAWLAATGRLEELRRLRLLAELDDVLVRRLASAARTAHDGAVWERVTGEVLAHRLDPSAAAGELIAGVAP
ncbi:MAG: methylmalonyl Co-A mutase-associated GTPase MeaB [Acidimicrobiales bacterium]